MSTPRKHHFVPQFYLGGFTPSGSKDDKLFVFDKQTGKQWSSSPGDVGCQRDFNVIEIDDGGDPNRLEKFFSLIETDGAEAIRLLVEKRQIPDGELYAKLISFMGLMTVRVPGSIEAVTKPFEGVYKSLLIQATASKERWEAIVADLKTKGQDVSDVPWEEMRDWARGDDYDIVMPQNFRMSSVLDMLKIIRPLLAARKWTLVSVPKDGPCFICSDRPLTLNWIGDRGQGFFGPGFGLAGTMATFPVSKAQALVGVFEAQTDPQELSIADVATANSTTAVHASRFVYSTREDFVINLGDGKVGSRKDLEALLQREKAERG